MSAVRKALVIGGTGPSGPAVVDALRERGYRVVLFHSGRHEVAGQGDLEHVHGDAFSRQSLDELLAGREFDVVVAMYGRTRYVADCLAGRCGQFVAIGGSPVYDGYFMPSRAGRVLAQPVAESAPLVSDETSTAPYPLHAIRRTEDAVRRHHESGSFSATILRYPVLYGPRVANNWEWLLIRRLLDGRPVFLADGGLSLHSRLAAGNAGAAVGGAVDRPAVVAGKAYNVADSEQFALRDWASLIAETLGVQLHVRSVPGDVPSPGWSLYPFGTPALAQHFLLDTTAARADLGYVDAVAPREALERAVAWSLEHAEQLDASMGIFLDYEAEDAFAAAYDRAMVQLRSSSGAFAAVPRPPG